MSRRPASFLWVRSIPIVVVVALVIACSHPSHDAPGTVQKEPESVPSAQQTRAPSNSTVPVPVARVAAAEPIPTPPETPMTAPAVPAPRSGDPKPTPSEVSPDPLKAIQEAEARRLEYEQSLIRLASERDTASGLVARRERDLLAFKNPFLARPKLAPDEAEEIKGMGGAERAKWAESRLADAKAVFEATQQAYDDAKASPPN